MSVEPETTVRWILHGRVQHIGFRWYTRSAAQELGVRGWVRNRADGSVEVEASGVPEVLSQLKDRLKRGPTGALVRGIDEQTIGHGSTPRQGFEIVR